MFMDKVTTTRGAAEEVWQESKLLDEPPSSLLALISWEEDDGQVTTVSVWESAADRGQAAADRMMPLFQALVTYLWVGKPHRCK